MFRVLPIIAFAAATLMFSNVLHAKGDDNGLSLNLAIGYSIADNIKFNSVEVSGAGTGSGTYEIVSEGAPSASIGLMLADQESFGFDLRGTMEKRRKLKGETSTINGSVISGTYVNPPTLDVSYAEFSPLYRFKRTYLGIGANYSFIKLRDPNVSTSTTTFKGSIGGQIMWGIFLSEGFHLSFHTRIIVMKGKTVDSSVPITADLGNGLLTGTTLALNYLF